MKLDVKLVLLCTAIILPLSCKYTTVSEASAVQSNEAETSQVIEPVETEAQRLDRETAEYLQGMTLEEKIGQLIFLQVRYSDAGKAARVLSQQHNDWIHQVQPGGIILFRENIETPTQVVDLITSIRENSEIEPFIAVDEEGGTVSRLTRSGKIGATSIPSAQALGQDPDTQAVYRAYETIGHELSLLGFNMNFAPVGDILTDPDNSVVGTRAFSSDPARAAELAADAVRGLQDQGIVSVIKHFPGHGESSGDSHYERLELDLDMNRLRDIELLPFEEAAKVGVGGMMTAHLFYPNIDGGHLPASISPYFIGTVLREEMDYHGLIITDALEMRGILDLMSAEEAGIQAISAGADMLLIPPDPPALFQALLLAVHEGRIDEAQLDQAVERIIRTKIQFGILYNQSMPSAKNALNELGVP